MSKIAIKVEGVLIKDMGETFEYRFIRNVIELLKSYLENPPLDKSWTQDRDSFR